MSVTIQESIPVTVNVTVVKCEDYGYAWMVKDLCLVGQSDTKEDISRDVRRDVNEFVKFWSNPHLKPKDV